MRRRVAMSGDGSLAGIGLGNLDFQDEQGDGTGNDAVAEGFDTSSLLLIVAPRVFEYLFQAIERLADVSGDFQWRLAYSMNQPWVTTSDWPVSAFDLKAAKNSAA